MITEFDSWPFFPTAFYQTSTLCWIWGTLPSVDDPEASGIVQIEAMMAGVHGRPAGRAKSGPQTDFAYVVVPRDATGIGAAVTASRTHPPDRVAGVRRARELSGVGKIIDDDKLARDVGPAPEYDTVEV